MAAVQNCQAVQDAALDCARNALDFTHQKVRVKLHTMLAIPLANAALRMPYIMHVSPAARLWCS